MNYFSWNTLCFSSSFFFFSFFDHTKTTNKQNNKQNKQLDLTFGNIRFRTDTKLKSKWQKKLLQKIPLNLNQLANNYYHTIQQDGYIQGECFQKLFLLSRPWNIFYIYTVQYLTYIFNLFSLDYSFFFFFFFSIFFGTFKKNLNFKYHNSSLVRCSLLHHPLSSCHSLLLIYQQRIIQERRRGWVCW